MFAAAFMGSRLGLAGLSFVVTTICIAAVAPWVAPFEPSAMNLSGRLLSPLGHDDQGRLHFLGTDQLGRDVFSRVVHGTRISLVVGFASVALAAAIGLVGGLAAGYLGGLLDAIVMRLVDLQLAFPFILLALAIIALLGATLPNIILVFALTSWPVYSRTIRASVLTIRSEQFVAAARSVGASDTRILSRHILPNVLSPIIVVASFEIARVVIAEAALGFLGLGVPPPTPTWGNMLADGRVYIRDAWWLSLFPGLAIMVLAAGVTFLGDGLRDALDPRLRR